MSLIAFYHDLLETPTVKTRNPPRTLTSACASSSGAAFPRGGRISRLSRPLRTSRGPHFGSICGRERSELSTPARASAHHRGGGGSQEWPASSVLLLSHTHRHVHRHLLWRKVALARASGSCERASARHKEHRNAGRLLARAVFDARASERVEGCVGIQLCAEERKFARSENNWTQEREDFHSRERSAGFLLRLGRDAASAASGV